MNERVRIAREKDRERSKSEFDICNKLQQELNEKFEK